MRFIVHHVPSIRIKNIKEYYSMKNIKVTYTNELDSFGEMCLN